MFVDSDDEWEEQTDSYEYRPELIPVSKPLEQDDNIYFLPIVEKKETTSCKFPPESFLHKVSRSASPLPNIAQRSAIDAGCSPKTVDALNNYVPSQLELIVEDVSEEDKEKLQQQMRKESISYWDSSSIYTGLGVDESGNYIGLSLARLNDLLCNVNQHLIIMRRDMIQHGLAIDDARQINTLENLGFNNVDNRRQLVSIGRNVKKSINDLTAHIDKLINKIEGKEETYVDRKYKIASGLLLGVAVGGILLAYFYRE